MFVGDSLSWSVSINGLQSVWCWQEFTVWLLSNVCAPTVFSLALKFVMLKFPGKSSFCSSFALKSSIFTFFGHSYWIFSALHIVWVQLWAILFFVFFKLTDATNNPVFNCRFQAPDLEVKLSDELAGSLRQLKVLDKLKFFYSVWPFPSEETQPFICNEFWFFQFQHTTT